MAAVKALTEKAIISLSKIQCFFNLVPSVELFLNPFDGLYFNQPHTQVIIFIWLSMCSTARRSRTGLALVGPAKVKAC